MGYTTIKCTMGYDRLRNFRLYVEKYSRTAGILCTEQELGGLRAPEHDVDTNSGPNCPGHMTKTANMTIYGNTLKNLRLWNGITHFNETWYVASGTQAHHSLYKS